MKIAVSGKGGAGKTTISATIARLFAQRGFSVLAIDGDPNPNLGVALGVGAPGLLDLAPVPRSILEQRTDEAGVKQSTLTQPIEAITAEHGIAAPDGVTLLLSTRVDHAGAGWLCSAHATVRGMLGQLIEQTGQLTIVDMEASVEHMSRGTVRHVDVMLIVVEPYYRALETAGRMAPLARDLGISQVYAVANKVRGERDEAAVRDYCAKHDLEVIACIPFDEAVGEADRAGISALDHDGSSSAVGEIRKLVDRLEAGA